MTQVFVLNSAYGAMTAAAAMDAGLFPEPSGDRILLAVNAAIVPETTTGIAESRQLQGVLRRFDRVESLNALVAPTPPVQWQPAADDLPMLERLLRRAWGIDDGSSLELFLQSPQVPPSRTLAAVFPGAPITIVGDGLMTYSPIRDRMPAAFADRVLGVAYADVVPGVEPLLFAETGAPRLPVPVDRFRSIVEEVAGAAEDPGLDDLAASAAPTVLILGQYLAHLGLVSADEEQALQAEMVDRALEWSPRRIVFKPHPSAPPAITDAVARRARAHGLEVATYDGEVPAEIVAARLRTVGVVAGFSTALPTVRALFGTPIASAGTELLLRRLHPYENGNRIPVTIVDALTRPGSPYTSPARLQHLLDTVGHTMQPQTAAQLRGRAASFLAGADPDERDRYVGARRLTQLRLPGGRRPGPLARLLTRSGVAGRFEQVRLIARGALRRAARAWKALEGR
ncbi:hypothetical protein FVP74_01195 [Microbacterium saccharophilum]|uniref:Uncharacterized protein n=1 Tax=Microbacterium saccharophilum TaxID=1213358 RepID=A0A5C8I6L5_9MICO|nr:polysialyltransferase family glycosyltransferase [Microbacterium saccharophilum]TXK15071.1 hypothetical protein FVP74_01195 [Microbacterium saccharophilum]GEP47478.1 hypothetical protein MSA03_09860 [Microbacterium saccharophilum]